MKMLNWRPVLQQAVAGAAMAIVIGLVGCSNPPANNGSGGANSAATPNGASAGGNASFRVGLVLDTGGVDDKSFNAAAYVGLTRAVADLKVEKGMTESKDPSEYKTNLTTFASQGYDLVFAVGYKMQSDLADVAKQFPNVKFAIVDGDAPNLPNCAALKFREEQGTFLAGFLAASMSKTKKIGFVGGEKIPLIQKFEAGYRAGAKAAGFDPDTQVIASYTGDWNDTTKGKNNAEQEFANGADIVFQAAGKGGLGVIQAAKERGKDYYAIGVDQDQDDVAPGSVLTSMVKHLDNAVYDTIQQAKSGKFQPGEHLYDLKQGGVGLSPMKNTKRLVPGGVLQNLQKLTELINSGQLVPPTTLEAVAAFQPPKL